MPHLTVPEDTFRRLAAKAAALNISAGLRGVRAGFRFSGGGGG